MILEQKRTETPAQAGVYGVWITMPYQSAFLHS